MKLTIPQVVGRFRYNKPKDIDEALHNCRVPIQYMFSGAFRDVYHIVGLPLIAKFPGGQNGNIPDGVEHSTDEVRWVRRINRSTQYALLREYMPTIYYFDKTNGVVLMHKYDELSWTKQNKKLCAELEQRMIKDLKFHHDPDSGLDPDIKPDNMGKDENGKIVIFDLGCFAGGQ